MTGKLTRSFIRSSPTTIYYYDWTAMTHSDRQERLKRRAGRRPPITMYQHIDNTTPEQVNMILGGAALALILIVGWCLRGVIWWLLVGVFYLGVAVLVILFLVALGGIAVLVGAGDLLSKISRRIR